MKNLIESINKFLNEASSKRYFVHYEDYDDYLLIPNDPRLRNEFVGEDGDFKSLRHAAKMLRRNTYSGDQNWYEVVDKKTGERWENPDFVEFEDQYEDIDYEDFEDRYEDM